MKRIIAMKLILALTLAMFTGCSKTGSQPDGNAQTTAADGTSETRKTRLLIRRPSSSCRTVWIRCSRPSSQTAHSSSRR